MGSHDEWFINVGGKLRGTDYFLSEQSFNAGRECVEKENAELKRLNTLCPMCGKETQWGDLVTCLGCAERMDAGLKECDELQAQLVRYEERQVIHLAWNKEMSITNNKLKNLLLVEEIKNHELRLEHGLWDKHSLVDIIYENKELRAQLASCVEALTESDKYLADGKLNQIGFGSILHRMIKDAIDSLPATAKPLSTKKMDMVWDLIKDVEDEGGRNE